MPEVSWGPKVKGRRKVSGHKEPKLSSCLCLHAYPGHKPVSQFKSLIMLYGSAVASVTPSSLYCHRLVNMHDVVSPLFTTLTYMWVTLLYLSDPDL